MLWSHLGVRVLTQRVCWETAVTTIIVDEEGFLELPSSEHLGVPNAT